MCRSTLIRRFLLFSLCWVLLGLRCVNAAGGIYYDTSVAYNSCESEFQALRSNPNWDYGRGCSVDRVSTPDAEYAYQFWGRDPDDGGTRVFYIANNGSCPASLPLRQNGLCSACPSGQNYDSSDNQCHEVNSCISGVTVAGSGFPVATPGHEGDGHSITYCSSAKCVMTAWESLNISYCADNSPSCPPITISRSEGRQTGASCSNPNIPANPNPECTGGMAFLGGVCVCPAGARLQGGVCRQNIDCSTGYHRVNDSCIADACPAGEIIQDNKCIPDPRSTVENSNPAPGEPPIACAAGRHYDVSLSSCVSNTAANGGTSGSPGTPGNPSGNPSGGSGGVGGGFPGESGSAESSDCAQPPVCAGDAVQCAMLVQVWRNHCESVPQAVIDSHPVPPVDTVDVGASATAALTAPSAVVFTAVCPAPVTFTVQSHQYQLEWTYVCQMASSIKPVLIGIASFFGLLIVAGVRRSGET